MKQGTKAALSRVARMASAVLLGGCGMTGVSVPPTTTWAPPPLMRSGESRPDVAALLSDIVATELCDQVRGRFLPIADISAEGVERGDEAVGGRWWVRRCDARLDQGRVFLYLEGSGWAWGEGGAWGFNLHDYIYFGGSAQVIGVVDASYESSRRIAWLQFRPVYQPTTTAAVIGNIETHANVFGSIIDFVSIGIAGGEADSRARGRADAKVRDAFQQRLASGFVVLFDLGHRQRDAFAVASVPPFRPFSSDRPWLVNERERLRAGTM